jgi:hypothetical protein
MKIMSARETKNAFGLMIGTARMPGADREARARHGGGRRFVGC